MSAALREQAARDEATKIRAMPVEEKKRLIGANTWVWGKDEFSSEDAAKAAREKAAKAVEALL